MQHLDEGTIHAWLDGALDAEEAARVEQHAAECATCASAVAEARGLIAGASRILTALDHTPGKVVPRSLGAGTSPATRRAHSVWNTLRLTPARAAAAAVVFLAAGTALVLQYKPNEKQLTSLVRAEGPVAKPAPVPATPRPAPTAVDSASVTRLAAPRAETAPPSAQVFGGRSAARASARQRAATESPEGAMRAEVVTKKTSAPPPPTVASVASAARVTVSDSVANTPQEARRLDSTALAARRQDVSANSARGVAAGAAAPAAAPARAPSPAPAAAVGGAETRAASRRADFAAKALLTPRAGYINYVGCYAVVADPATGLPQRLSLDTARVDQQPVAQKRGLAAADAALFERFTITDLSSATRHTVEGATWEPLANGAIRLTLGAPARSVELQAMAGGTSAFVGVMKVGDRGVPVTLQRVECSR